MAQERLQALYTIAHTDVRSAPFHNQGRTLRLVVESNSTAHAVSVLFSNLCGKEAITVGSASLALCDANGRLLPKALVPLTVGGVLDFTLEPGAEVWSDEARFPLHAGEHFAVNLYYPTDTPVTSGNWSNSVYRSKPGNFCADLDIGAPNLVSRLARTVIPTDVTTAATTVRRIVAHTQTPGRVLACFGDSITQQNTWTVPLARRLYKAYPGEITLCNLGISGNRLLHNGANGTAHGEAGIRRFERDVLAVEGLTHAILQIGTNDIGQPGRHGIPTSELPTLDLYAETMTGLAATLHGRGVKVFAATLCPRVIAAPYNEAREAMRHAMNDWLRTADCFDAVLDFDAVTCREDGKPGMKDKYVLPDGLHPTVYGGLRIAKAIPLSLFAGGGVDG